MSAVCVRALAVHVHAPPASSSALTVLSAVIQSLIAPQRVWTMIQRVVSVDGGDARGEQRM